MLVLFINQCPISILHDSVDLDLAGDHLCGLQGALVEGFDNTRKIGL
jgi:hypothetical protein